MVVYRSKKITIASNRIPPSGRNLLTLTVMHKNQINMDNSEIVKNIWFASEKRALSASKILVYDDQGSLEVDGDKLIFLSSKERLIFDQIQDISLSRQRWNWIAWILGLLIILPIYFLCYFFKHMLFYFEIHFY